MLGLGGGCYREGPRRGRTGDDALTPNVSESARVPRGGIQRCILEFLVQR